MTQLENANIKIREIKPGDELQTAQVHIRSWQETYRGLVPQIYLDQLPEHIEDRIKMWTAIIKNPNRWAWVAEGDQGIVGFSLFGPPRDSGRENFIELGAIYLLASEKSKGIGFSLLKTGFLHMQSLGYQKAYCWVLDNNPTIQFYVRSGATFSKQTKVDEIGGQTVTELAYEWPHLNL